MEQPSKVEVVLELTHNARECGIRKMTFPSGKVVVASYYEGEARPIPGSEWTIIAEEAHEPGLGEFKLPYLIEFARVATLKDGRK
jgi:hypothetical protein